MAAGPLSKTNASRPLALIALLVSATFWLFAAVATDTAFYTGPAATTSFRALFKYVHTVPVLTPINNVLYNTKASNLKQHGLHPHYQHILVNLPQLLGPALPLLTRWPPRFSAFHLDRILSNPCLTSAITGTLILSAIPHQEPRFLLPVIPLLLTCVKLPQSKLWYRRFWISWALFNAAMGVLMGIYHQGGIVPVQLSMSDTITASLISTHSPATNIHVHWWKTYPPSLYMLGPTSHNPSTNDPLSITTTPLLGASTPTLLSRLTEHLPLCGEQQSILQEFANAVVTDESSHTLLVAPFAAFRPQHFLDGNIPPVSNFTFTLPTDHDHGHQAGLGLRMTHLSGYRRHVNLDDMDLGEDGIIATLGRVVGRRGLGVWRVERACAVA